MKKLTTLFAVASLGTALALTGCKKKDDGNATSADKPAEGVKADKAAPATPDQAAPAAAPAAAGAAAPAAAGDLPAECNDYKASIDKLASCDKMPQAGARRAEAGVRPGVDGLGEPPGRGEGEPRHRVQGRHGRRHDQREAGLRLVTRF